MSVKILAAQSLDKRIYKEVIRKSPVKRVFFIILAVLILSFVFGGSKTNVNWSNQGYKIAPRPNEHADAVIQVYSARTWGAKSALAVHTWIAIKEKNAEAYSVSQVIGWRQSRYGTSLFTETAIPDKGWYGNPPILLRDLRGKKAEELISKIKDAIANYPWTNDYTVWPGPNSNTFIAWIGLQVPELALDLPATAIGKDWRPIEQMLGPSPSGSGLQASLLGLVGLSVGIEEGLEINILGLSFEFDVFDLAIELPGYGRIGGEPANLKVD